MQAPNPKRWLVISLLGLLPNSGCTREAATKPTPTPWSLNPSHVDLGEVSSGRKVQTIVQLTNHSGRRASVPRFSLSCDCIAVEPEAKELDDGQSTPLAIYFDSTLEGKYPGEFSFRLKADDGRREVFHLASIRVRVLGSEPSRSTAP